MKITLKVGTVINRLPRKAGETVEVDADLGARLCEAGLAAPESDVKVERAVEKPKTEKATSKRKWK